MNTITTEGVVTFLELGRTRIGRIGDNMWFYGIFPDVKVGDKVKIQGELRDWMIHVQAFEVLRGSCSNAGGSQ